MTSSRVVCAWLRNDLRVHDSPVLHQAAVEAQQHNSYVLPVYVLDPWEFRLIRNGTPKTGAVRALFLLQSVVALKRRLRELGSDLLVAVGRPPDVLPKLLPSGSLLLTQREVTSEELRTDALVRASLAEGVTWEYCWGSTLFHINDLPFRATDLSDMPDVFTRFKNQVEPELACAANHIPPSFTGEPKLESRIQVRPCLPEIEEGSLPLPPLSEEVLEFEPAWEDLPFSVDVMRPLPNEKGVLNFVGGEKAALARLTHYLAASRLISNYADTRNGMLGADYSSKFAPWLARGCLSPRRVFEQLREHERFHGACRSTYWFLFSLMARDFFRFFAAKHGDAIFRAGGVIRRIPRWHGGNSEFELWTAGRTGFPFVDANMRELLATGWMSNRGRQNVASFLALDLCVDWRRGAAWFETHLVDYDVTANWANWMFAAGLTGGRVNRFNVVKQSLQYDVDGAYLRHWLPELSGVPDARVHQPWQLIASERKAYGADTYPSPCLDPSAFPTQKSEPGSMGARGAAGGARQRHAARNRPEAALAKRGAHVNFSTGEATSVCPAEGTVRDEEQGRISRHQPSSTPLMEWLRGIDSGEGFLLRAYGVAVEAKLQSIENLHARYRLAGGGFDAASFCDDFGVAKLGHRRLLFRWAAEECGAGSAFGA